jgi:uncharacterized protein with HEPN domain
MYEKIDYILEMIENIEKIIKRHGGIINALEDFEGQMAIFMGINQIGEILNKFPEDFIQKYNLTEEKRGAYYTRNYIVHDYEGVDLIIIEKILRYNLPLLKDKMLKAKND